MAAKPKTYWDGMVDALAVLHKRDTDMHARVLNELLCEPLHTAAKKAGKLKKSGIGPFINRTGRNHRTFQVAGNEVRH